MFSRKNIQSMPSDGTRTGRTLAKRSSSFRMPTFADSRFGQPSPFSGVVVGPFSVTSHSLISAKTSSGIDCRCAARFSMVRPSMFRNTTLPLATASPSRRSKTPRADSVIAGPIPSPPMSPISIVSSAL